MQIGFSSYREVVGGVVIVGVEGKNGEKMIKMHCRFVQKKSLKINANILYIKKENSKALLTCLEPADHGLPCVSLLLLQVLGTMAEAPRTNPDIHDWG